MADTVLEVRKPRSKKSILHSAKTRRQRGYHWEDTIVIADLMHLMGGMP